MVAPATKSRKQKDDDLGAVYQQPLPLFDVAAALVLARLEGMNYDDALIRHERRGWRIEYLYLDAGLPHYRIYKGEQLFGLVDIRHPNQLMPIQLKLAFYLAALGFAPDTFEFRPRARKTAMDAGKDGDRIPLVGIPEDQQKIIHRNKGVMKYEVQMAIQHPKYSYVARKSCGCIYAMIPDHSAMRTVITKYQERWTRAGATVERMKTSVARKRFKGWNCDHDKKRQSAQPMPQTIALFEE